MRMKEKQKMGSIVDNDGFRGISVYQKIGVSESSNAQVEKKSVECSM